MTDKVKVMTLKGFINEGQYIGRRREISVSETRARDLERGGLVTREIRKAQEPSNKMASDPDNKGASGSQTEGENPGGAASGEGEGVPADASKPPAFSPELLERNAPELVAWAADIGDRDQLQAALAGEREGKARKGVIEALEKALAD